MVVRTKLEIMCGSFFPRHHKENPRNSIDLGVAHLKLSDVTYRVQEVKNCRRRLVVHFNRLKPYKGKVADRQPLRREVSPDMQTQSEEPRHHYFGSQLELADEGDIEVSIAPSASEHNTELGIEPQGESRHYPQ